MSQKSYAKTSKYSGSFEQAIVDTTLSLKNEGFGILTQINVQETLKNKLNVDYQKYMILGACNPPNAYKALKAEKEIGLLLPCNVVVYEDGNEVYISVMRPTTALTISQNSEIAEIALEVEEKLFKALENVVKK